MVPAGSQDAPRDLGPHLLLYDGECGLCNRIVQFVLQRDPRGVFHFASLQSSAAATTMARFGARPDDLDTFVVVVGYRTGHPALLVRGRAAVFVLAALGGPWKAAALLRLLPRTLLDRGYDLIARNRRRFFPLDERCLVPRPDYRTRFVDSGVAIAPDSKVSP